MTNIDCVLDIMLSTCPGLVGISVAGWKNFTSEQLAYLVEEFKSLERIDLTSVNVRRSKIQFRNHRTFIEIFQLELNPNKSAVGPQSLCNAIQILGSRLTHLGLAHNRLSCIPQIVAALSVNFPFRLALLTLFDRRNACLRRLTARTWFCSICRT